MTTPFPNTTVFTSVEERKGSSTDTRSKVRATQTSELVIALCGPIGSPIHAVAKQLRDSILKEFQYTKCEIIRLSKIIAEHAPEGTTIPEGKDQEYEKIKKLIELGDVLRKEYGKSVLVEIAIGTIITVDRESRKVKSGAPNYEPARVCHIIDSIKNQEELNLLRDVYGDMLYCVGVFSPLSERENNLKKREMKPAQIHDLIDKDSGEEFAHGQKVGDTFPQADFFLRIDSDTDSKIAARVQRFLHIILGTKIITPTKAENAMYAAASAAGNSACLSRQVGAAIVNDDGEVLGLGWNDVPKFGGNLYGSEPLNSSGENDHRCWNLQGGTCFNDQEKKYLAELIVESLIHNKDPKDPERERPLIQPSNKNEAIRCVQSNTKLQNLIEFSRSVHAEMHAIIVASQVAGDQVKNSQLYCTTYPCHSCARHIIAAGIKDVYYIEPYRKSLAIRLHGDAMTESETGNGKVRILPYDGVAPSKYLKLFRMEPNSRKTEGKMSLPDAQHARPRFDKSLEALPALEALVVKTLKEKKLLPLSEVSPNEERNDAST